MLTDYQTEIVRECLAKGGGGLSLPMGSGKTIISLVLALKYFKQTGRPSLVVASKTLIAGWIQEIEKFLGSKFKLGADYVVLHNDYMKTKA